MDASPPAFFPEHNHEDVLVNPEPVRLEKRCREAAREVYIIVSVCSLSWNFFFAFSFIEILVLTISKTLNGLKILCVSDSISIITKYVEPGGARKQWRLLVVLL